MTRNNLLSEPSEHSSQDNDVIKQREMIAQNVAKEEGEKEICQNCGDSFFPYDDYVTLCSMCRYELLGI